MRIAAAGSAVLLQQQSDFDWDAGRSIAHLA
jgi:hypothetical protein